MLLENKPLVAKNAKISEGKSRSNKILLKPFYPRTLLEREVAKISTNHTQINMVLASALIENPRVKATIKPNQFGLQAAITIEVPVPRNLFKRYINIRMPVRRSTTGLQFGQISISQIEIPITIYRPVFTSVIDRLIKPGFGEALLKAIENIKTIETQTQGIHNKEDLVNQEPTNASEIHTDYCVLRFVRYFCVQLFPKRQKR